MINIIFEYTNKNYVFQIKKNLITWNKLFDFINNKLQITRNNIRFSINGMLFYGNKSLQPFNYNSFVQKNTKGDFIIIKVSVIPNFS